MPRRSSLSCCVPHAVYDTILMTSAVEVDVPAFLSSFDESYLTSQRDGVYPSFLALILRISYIIYGIQLLLDTTVYRLMLATLNVDVNELLYQ